ncbi:MAG: nuclear transport factor 2 family protein [Acidimicrobiia bacterium]|nr:nuclear transport factor 2 family protein [Acidimicrobiia bacterium]
MVEIEVEGPDGLSPLGRVVARDEIRQLAYRYAAAIDRRAIEELASLFAPDADFGESGTGPAGAAALFGQSLREVGMAVLLVGNHLIDFDDPTHAHGQVWCRGYIDDHRDGFIEQMIQYRDRYVVVDGQWRFTGRRHLLWYGVATAESPLTQPDADWPRRQVGRGSLPYREPSWGAFWDDAGSAR